MDCTFTLQGAIVDFAGGHGGLLLTRFPTAFDEYRLTLHRKANAPTASEGADSLRSCRACGPVACWLSLPHSWFGNWLVCFRLRPQLAHFQHPCLLAAFLARGLVIGFCCSHRRNLAQFVEIGICQQKVTLVALRKSIVAPRRVSVRFSENGTSF